MSTISDHQQSILNEFILLTPGETEAHAAFDTLAHATNAQLTALGHYETRFVPWPSAFFGLDHLTAVGAKVSDGIVAGWQRLAELYPALARRNPRLDLRDAMQDISERNCGAMSWPDMMEWDIERWVADGAPCPHRMTGLVDPDQRERLLALHPRLGGWLYYDEVGLRFAETRAFRAVKVKLDAERQERIDDEKRKFEEVQGRIKRLQEHYKIPEGSGNWVIVGGLPDDVST